MTSTPTPPPPERRSLGSDELIAVVIAFLGIGSILWWGISRSPDPVNGLIGAQPSPTDAATRRDMAVLTPPIADELEEDDAERDRPRPQTSPETDSTLYTVEPVPPTRPERAIAPVPVPIPASNPAPQPASEVPRDTGFSDVPPDFWAAPFIAELVQRQIITGFPDNTYRPNQPVTRAEFASMIDSAFGEQAVKRDPQAFADVPPAFWASSEINKSYQIGFLEGYPGAVFYPELQIPKVQALVALTKGLNLIAPQDPVATVQTFEDAEQIPNYAIAPVAAATTAGLVVNYPSPQTLQPNLPATRAEIAALIYQALVEANQAEPIESPYLVSGDR